MAPECVAACLLIVVVCSFSCRIEPLFDQNCTYCRYLVTSDLIRADNSDVFFELSEIRHVRSKMVSLTAAAAVVTRHFIAHRRLRRIKYGQSRCLYYCNCDATLNHILDIKSLLERCGDIHLNPGPTNPPSDKTIILPSDHQNRKIVYTANFLLGLRYRHQYWINSKVWDNIHTLKLERQNYNQRGLRAGKKVQRRAAMRRAMLDDRHIDSEDPSIYCVGHEEAAGNLISVVVGSGRLTDRLSTPTLGCSRRTLNDLPSVSSQHQIANSQLLPAVSTTTTATNQNTLQLQPCISPPVHRLSSSKARRLIAQQQYHARQLIAVSTNNNPRPPTSPATALCCYVINAKCQSTCQN